MGSFERVLLDLKLTLEQIYGVLEGWIGNAVYRDSMILARKGAVEDQFIKLVDQVVYVCLEYFEAFVGFITELGHALLNERVHIFDRSEASTTDFFIHKRCLALSILKILVLTNL